MRHLRGYVDAWQRLSSDSAALFQKWVSAANASTVLQGFSKKFCGWKRLCPLRTQKVICDPSEPDLDEPC